MAESWKIIWISFRNRRTD